LEKTKDSLIQLTPFFPRRFARQTKAKKLHGGLSDFTRLCAFWMGLCFNMMAVIRKFYPDSSGEKLIPTAAKRNLQN
jgi:hypothetical protein